jgi:omega-hydroxy-beta-dihydromenaquinone-9 sulfotransferase
MSRVSTSPARSLHARRLTKSRLAREVSRKDPDYGVVPFNPLGFRVLGKALKRRLTPWRALNWAGYAVAIGAFEAVIRGAQRLDDVLYPEWRDQPIDQPVFIIGNPRSGTTMLHRLVSMDEAAFAPLTLAHTFFPAVTFRKTISAMARIDEKVPGHPGRRFVDAINRVFFSGWDGIHQMGIDKAEEDEAIFLFAFNTVNFCLMVPDMESLLPLAKSDEDDVRFQRRFMEFYEAQMRKHLFADGKNRRFLNKNVFMMGRLERLDERFPDAKYVYLVRHPYEAIPSFLSMWWEKWISDDPKFPKEGTDTRILAELAVYYYERAMTLREQIGAERFHVVDYRDLVRDPRGTVHRIYDFLGMEIRPEFQRALEDATRHQKEYESRHDYSLTDFGLSESWVYDRLAPFFDAFHFDP